ncbi:MAG: hypothetical protein GEV10_16645 [Streptosporangiales bacterium]|nr:hypothetical protein [Streptosporangiales bacterium]
MKSMYRVLAYTIAVLVALQAAWVALSAFGVINAVDSGTVIDESYEPNAGAMLHGIGGMYVIPVVTLALLVVSFFAHIAGGVKWALFIVLAVALQIAFGFVAFGLPAIGLLHGVNAFVILGLAVTAAMRVSRTTASATSEPMDRTAA